MKNLKGDLIWALGLSVWIMFLVVPSFRTEFIHITEVHPYLGGFVKFFILASMGDLLGIRILTGKWLFPTGFFYKAIVWGILGTMVTLVFTVFMVGAAGAQTKGLLPFSDMKWSQAFFGSTIMNLTFGPMLYIYHKFADLYIDMSIERKTGILKDKFNVKDMVNRIDWYNIVTFSWLKTCLLIWIPLHTLVFLMPVQYRVLASAFLSILLGILIAMSKKDNKS